MVPTDQVSDVFISHASEDKDEIARPLAEALQHRSLIVWYDDYVLTLGDSLREVIDRGLSSCRFGVVILSPAFFAKEWPKKELNGLLAKETFNGAKVLLPVWHKVTYEDVVKFSPILADKLAVSTARGLDFVVEQILRAIVPRKDSPEAASARSLAGSFQNHPRLPSSEEEKPRKARTRGVTNLKTKASTKRRSMSWAIFIVAGLLILIAVISALNSLNNNRQQPRSSEVTITPAPVETPAAPSATVPFRVISIEIGKAIDLGGSIIAASPFDPNDAIIAVVHTEGVAPRVKLTAKWTYGDQGQSVKDDDQTIYPTGPGVTEFHVSKPSGWPVGKYKVEILADGVSAGSKDFEVKK